MTRCNCESTSHATKFSRTVTTGSASKRCSCASTGNASSAAPAKIDRSMFIPASFLSDKAISVILIYPTMLPPAYLSKKLIPPLPTKDGGMLRTIREACEYMAAIGKERELRRHWQHVRKLILEEADV